MKKINLNNPIEIESNRLSNHEKKQITGGLKKEDNTKLYCLCMDGSNVEASPVEPFCPSWCIY